MSTRLFVLQCVLAILALVFAAKVSLAVSAVEIGIQVRDLNEAEALEMGFAAPRGAKVTNVAPGKPAATTGLKIGDVLVSLDGVEISDAASLDKKLGERPSNLDSADLNVRWLRPKSDAGPQREFAKALALDGVANGRSLDRTAITLIDTGGHRALIKSVAFTPDGKYVVSAGNDKEIRVWDAETGKTKRIIRGFGTTGSEGKLYAMAMSPNGKLLAAAGYTRDDEVRLIDFASGTIVRLLKGHSDVVSALAFSPDSKLLVSGGADRTVIIWDVATGKPLSRLSGHMAEVYAVAFTSDGERVVTGAFDNMVRLWRVSDGKLIQPMTGHKAKVRAIAVNAKDGVIATGSYDGDIRLWNGQTGESLGVFVNQAPIVGSMTFTADGKRLISTCGGGHPCLDHVWDYTQRPGKELGTHQIDFDIAPSVAVSPDGRWAATAGGSNQVIQIWDPGTNSPPGSKIGQVRTGPDGKPLQLAGVGLAGWAVGISTDGRAIAWGRTWTHDSGIIRGPLQIQLKLPIEATTWGKPEPVVPSESASGNVPPDQLPPPPSSNEKSGGSKSAPIQLAPTDLPGVIPIGTVEFVWRRAQSRVGSISISHRPGGAYGDRAAVLDIAQNGRTMASITKRVEDGYEHRSYTLTADGKYIISGGNNGSLIAYDLNGKRLIEFVGHQGDVWSVATSADGKYLISGSADQTIRLWPLWRVKDADVGPKKFVEPIVSIFDGADGEWAAWTPQGYFTGSDSAGRLLGWQINRGADQNPLYFAAEQLYKKLLRPDIVAKAIEIADGTAAARDKGGNFSFEDFQRRPPPIIEVKPPTQGFAVAGGKLAVQLAVTPTPDPVQSYKVYVNGSPVDSQAALFRTDGIVDFSVPLASGTNLIELRASNAIGDSAPNAAKILIFNDGPAALKPGRLYILAIGAQKYPNVKPECGLTKNQSCDLTYTGADAKAFAAAIEKRLGTRYTGIESRVLFNGAGGDLEPTSNNIRNELRRLLRGRTSSDTVVLFVAGHGTNDRDDTDYLFLPTDARRTVTGDWFGSSVLGWTELEADLITSSAGLRLVFVDTCHSAGALNKRFGAVAQHEKIIAFTATDQVQNALESSKLGHGLFTAALLAALDLAPTGTGQNEPSVKGLRDRLVAKTAELMQAHFQKEPKPWPKPQLLADSAAFDRVLAGR